MSTFQQPCPTCDRSLSLPDAALGKTAKCPVCLTEFVANGPPQHHPANPTYAGSHGPPPAATPNAGTPNAGNPAANPYLQAPNPYTQELDKGPAPPGSVNPYAPMQPAPAVTAGPLQIRAVGFDEIWSAAWEITKAKFGVILGMIVIMFAISIGISLLGQLMVAIGSTIDPAVALVMTFATILLSLFFNAYTTVGMAGAALAIVRNQPSPLSQLFAPIQGVLKYIGILVLLLGFVGISGGIVAGLVFAVGQDAEELAVVGTVIAVVVLVLVMLVVGMLIWPLGYLCAENRTGFRENISICYSIFQENMVTVLLLLFLSGGLTMLGMLMCYVGILLTAPLVTMLVAVSYLLMTGQSIAVPQRYTPPPMSH